MGARPGPILPPATAFPAQRRSPAKYPRPSPMNPVCSRMTMLGWCLSPGTRRKSSHLSLYFWGGGFMSCQAPSGERPEPGSSRLLSCLQARRTD